MRPGLPSRPRPTGELHFAQYRFSSATSAMVMIASSGLVTGVEGTLVIPAPMRLTRRDAPARRRVRTEVEPRAEPSGALASCRELVARVRVDPATEAPVGIDAVDAVGDVPGGGSGAEGVDVAAIPQTLQ